MHAQQLEFQQLIDEFDDMPIEVLFVARERKQHTNGERTLDDERSAQIYDNDVFEAEDQRIGGVPQQQHLGALNTAVQRVGVMALPTHESRLFLVIGANRANGAHRLEKAGFFLCAGANLGECRALKSRQLREAPDEVDRAGPEDRERQRGAIGKHHRDRRQRHAPIDDNGDQTLGQRVPHRCQRAEARHDVAQMPFLEPLERQAQHVIHQAPRELERQQMRQARDQPPPRELRRQPHQQHQSETESQQSQ